MSGVAPRVPQTAAAPVAYPIAGAAAATGLGVTVIRAEVKAGRIPVHYLNSKPLILASDLLAWVTGLPTQRPERDLPASPGDESERLVDGHSEAGGDRPHRR